MFQPVTTIGTALLHDFVCLLFMSGNNSKAVFSTNWLNLLSSRKPVH